MSTSDWIALAACIASFIALIPQLAPMLRKKGQSRAPSQLPLSDQSPQPDSSSRPPTGGAGDSSAKGANVQKPNVQYKDMNLFGKSLVLAAYGICIGVIELVLFSAIATLCGVEVDPAAMPFPWKVIFYALCVMPGIFLFWSVVHLFNLFEDPKE